VALPRSALLATWLNAWLRGSVGVDDLAEAVRGDDPQHLVLGWPGVEAPLSLLDLPAALAALGEPRVHLALPVPGDPLGLAGPAAFNAAALDAGEAVVLAGRDRTVGLVPALDARTVLWTAAEAVAPHVLDPREEGRALRQVLLTATAELVRLDVAAWNPDVPDLLLNRDRRPVLVLPRDATPDQVEALERADLCLDVVDTARETHGGTISAHEVAARARCLTELDHAARRTVAAVCSASLLPS
jgi:hypothetical protein